MFNREKLGCKNSWSGANLNLIHGYYHLAVLTPLSILLMLEIKHFAIRQVLIRYDICTQQVIGTKVQYKNYSFKMNPSLSCS